MLTRIFDWITRTSIRFRWAVIVMAVLLLAAGIYAATTLNLELLPRIEFPQTVVVAQWPDAESPEQFLDEVTVELENNLADVPGVVNVESTTGSSFAYVIVRNEFGLDQDQVLDDIQEAVDTSELPEGADIQVLNFSLSDLPVVVASVSSSELTLPELKALVSEDVQPRLAEIENVSEVAVSGGQELPAETVAEEPEPTPEPGRLPLIFREGAAAFGVDLEVAQDVTPEVLAQILVEQEATNEQVLTVLNLFPAELLPYAPPETLALLPTEYMSTLDPALLEELDGLAAEYGGINRYTIDQARSVLQGEEVAEAEPTATAAPTAEPTVEPAAEPVALPEIEPVDLPESWVAAAAQFGQTLTSTADITPEAMGAIAGTAPELLQDLTPEMWRSLDPASVAVALPAVQEDLEPTLLAELQAIQLAANGEEPEPVELPESWVAAASQFGQTLATTADITPEAMIALAGAAPQLLDDLTPQQILAFSPATQAALPAEYVAGLDEGLQQTLTNIAVYVARLETQPAGETEEATEVEPVPDMEPVDLPESWVAAAAQFGQTLATTADVTPEAMGAISGAAPELLQDLTPEMWRALDPAAVAAALPAVQDNLDPGLLAQLLAIQAAASGQNPEAVDLPESWVAAASQFGQRLATTADITPEAMMALAGAAPELLEDLTPEQILAFTPAVQAVMPEAYLAEMEPDLQAALQIIAIRNAQHVATQAATTPEEPAEPTPTPDPARLPDALIQGAQQFGVTLEYAYDITPEFMRQIGAAGPQAVVVLQMLTADNLRNLQPEVIALLPADFVASLDADLRAELDELAAEYGGAGQLALEEAQAAEEEAAGAPPLSGPWIEPQPDGTPSQFETAADILNNPFTTGVPNPAAAFIGFLPTAPQIEDPVAWIQALTPDIIAYLAENEAGFAAALTPEVLRLMSPESLTYLLENYPDAYDPALAEELQLIAAGEIEAFVPEASITRTDGDPAVIISVYKAGDANTVVVAHDVFDALDAYEAEHPGLSYALAFEQATFIEDSISGVAREGGLGALFAIVVILIFLSGTVNGRYKPAWRATLVVGVSIPLSIAVAFLLMKVIPATFGVWIHDLALSTGSDFVLFVSRLFPTSVTLNIMTLSGLTVAIGRVVDDSIVVLENSYRYIQRSDDNAEAIAKATREVAIAIFASTMTTIAVFLPLGLLGGIIGSFFLPFGLTVTYALMVSFFVAIIVVPALSVVLIRRQDIPEEKETRMQRWYTPPLRWALEHRGATMAIATVVFLASLFLLTQLPRSFIPAIGEPTINVSVNLPNGTTMQETDAVFREFETSLAAVNGLETIQSEIGSGGGIAAAFFGGGGVSQNVGNVTVSVEDLEELQQITLEVRELAEETFGVDNTTVSAASQTGLGGFSLILTGDSVEQLAPVVEEVKQALSEVDMDEDGEPDIVNISSSIDNVGTNGASTIIRIDGQPAISFSGELETENTLGVTQAAKEAIGAIEGLPVGAEVTEGFESEQQTRGFADMTRAIGYSVIIVYLIMALSFRSLIHPFTILFSLPFALVGASVALFISDSVLGISAMIGLMMLVGIVVTNAIVLLELVQQLRKRGETAKQALLEGGRTRLRPIWMTALTAVLALLPLAASQEAGAVIASELAITVIGGLLVSTFLTLLVVPVVYSLFDDVAARFRRKPAAR